MRVVGSRIITSACLYHRRHRGRLWRSLTFGLAAALAGAWHGAALDQAAAPAQPVVEVQAPLVSQPPFPRGNELEITAGSHGVHVSPQVAMFADGGFAVVWEAAADPESRGALHARLFAADGSPSTGELLLRTGEVPAAQAQIPESLVADAAGNLLLLYEQPDPETNIGSIQALRIDRRGALLDRPLQVDEPGPFPDGSFGAVGAAMPAASGGGFTVGWSAAVPEQPDSVGTDIRLRQLDSGGRPVGPERDVYQGHSLRPGVSGIGVAADGSVVLSLVQGLLTPVVRFQRITPDGKASPPRRVTPGLSGIAQQDGASLSMASDGSFAIVWNQLATGAGALQAVVARFFAPDGTPRTGVIAVSRPRPAHQAINYNGGGAAPLPGGGVVTVWEDESGAAATGTSIRLRSLAGDGSPLTRVLQLNQSTAAGYERGSAVIAGNGAGRYVAVWLETPVRAGLTESIRARLLQAAGASPNP
jgi:hypothetical protein